MTGNGIIFSQLVHQHQLMLLFQNETFVQEVRTLSTAPSLSVSSKSNKQTFVQEVRTLSMAPSLSLFNNWSFSLTDEEKQHEKGVSISTISKLESIVSKLILLANYASTSGRSDKMVGLLDKFEGLLDKFEGLLDLVALEIIQLDSTTTTTTTTGPIVLPISYHVDRIPKLRSFTLGELRFLDLSGQKIFKLPDSISRLSAFRVAYIPRTISIPFPFHFIKRKVILRWSSTGRTSKTSKGLPTSEYDPNITNFVYENGMNSLCFTTPDSQRVLPDSEYDPNISNLVDENGTNSEYDPNISNLVHEKGMKSGCFTTPDSQRVLPNCGDIDVVIEKMLLQAGAKRARDLSNHNSDNDAAIDHSTEGCHKPSHNAIKAVLKSRRRDYLCCVLLLMATLLAQITYQAKFSLPAGTLKQGYGYNYAGNGPFQLKKRDSIVNRSFILFNSTGFVASLAVILLLLHEIPLKPWPQISVSTLFGSYICLIMATSPREALKLLFLAIPFLLLAAAGKLHGFARPRTGLN